MFKVPKPNWLESPVLKGYRLALLFMFRKLALIFDFSFVGLITYKFFESLERALSDDVLK